jgi:hypothetical protein
MVTNGLEFQLSEPQENVLNTEESRGILFSGSVEEQQKRFDNVSTCLAIQANKGKTEFALDILNRIRAVKDPVLDSYRAMLKTIVKADEAGKDVDFSAAKDLPTKVLTYLVWQRYIVINNIPQETLQQY